MSTRIIIEKNGERYVANDLKSIFIDSGRALSIENKFSHEYISSTYTRLPPVERTDNSAKCDCKDCAFRGMELCEHRKLIDENAKLREALKPIMECDIGLTDSVYAISTAKSIMKGISRKDEDISRKGGAE